MSLRFGSEKELEDALFEGIGYFSDELGISENAKVIRQFTLPGYGTTDILAIDVGPGFTMINIIELKNEPLKLQDVAQLSRYMSYFDIYADREVFDVSGILIGPKTYPNDKDDVFLMQSMSRISVYEFDFEITSGLTLGLVDEWKRVNSENLDHSWLDEHVMKGPENG